MKSLYAFIGCLLLTGIAAAQEKDLTDSVRTVLLQEVTVAAQQRGQQQHLYRYFTANKAATTEDIMARIPELSLVRRGSYGMEPIIRSFNSNQVALLLDGMRIHGACTDKMDPTSIYIEPVNLNSMEVRTNGSSLLVGSSVGGSINMKLAEASCHDEGRFSGSASTGYHSASRAFFSSANFNYATSRFGLRATGTYRNSGAYRDGSGQRVPFSQYEKVNYTLHGKLKLNDGAYLRVDLLADDGWNIGYPALPMDVGYANARIGSVTFVQESGWRGWERAEAKLYANRVKHYMDDTKRPAVPMHMDMPGVSRTSGMYAEAVRSLGVGQKLQLRADASATMLKASMTMYQPGQPDMYMLTWPDNRQVQGGVAAQYQLRIDSATQVQVSGRVDVTDYALTSQGGKDQLAVFGYSGEQMGFVIPALSVQVSRKLFPSLKASFSLGMNGRAPSAGELFGFYLFNQFDGHDYIGNTKLRKEIGQQAELTLSWQQQKWKVQASGYISKVRHYIFGKINPGLSVMTPGARGVKTYENTAQALLAGGEGSVVYQPFSGTQLVSTLKYAHAQDNTGNPLPLIAPLRNISTLRQHFNALWLQAEMELAAAQRRVSVAANERSTGAFSLVHLRAGYQLQQGRVLWQLNAGVENILDAYYREHLDWGNIARPGRNVYMQVSVGF
ncbi:TonB-dependent receptor domain-containing protein [Paracnuella aquatica]|uniref:TonB-dependent receptor domain-containing protein n=1 Tax=Paracnuella aquatica TaxID=2268757 RepID=UPI000DEF721F|nr:TonB-dependent receptor [Paracnuella aquatica]RPD43545.1 TonB-dependent receptor [Paracnuella aquatica]